MSGQDSPDQSGRDQPDKPAPDPPPAPNEDPAAPRRPIGGAVFTLEGRAAPGLYLVGWIATVLGLAIAVAVLAGGPSGGAGIALAVVATLLLSVGLVAAAGAQGIERRAHQVAAYAGPSPFLVFAASVPVTLLLAFLVLAPLEALGVPGRSPVAVAIQEALLLIVNVGLLRLLVVSPGALSWRDMGLDVRGIGKAVRDLASGAILAIPVWLATVIAVAIAITFLHHTPDNPLPPSSDAASLAVNLVTAAILAPLAEEIFFRGFATTAWVATMGPEQGLARGAIFFAFVHVFNASGVTFGDALAEGAVGFVARIPVGFALGWIYLRRRSLLASVGLHSSFNGIQVALAYLSRAA